MFRMRTLRDVMSEPCDFPRQQMTTVRTGFPMIDSPFITMLFFFGTNWFIFNESLSVSEV
jgi:hypothetical protein